MSENQKSELDTTELIGLVEGTVSELKKYVNQKNFSDKQIEQILEAEAGSKNRKTAKRFLNKQIETSDSEKNSSNPNKDDNEPETRKIDAEETSLTREALLHMLGGTVEDVKDYVKENNPDDQELQSLLHAEKIVKDRKTVVRFLKSYSKKKELEEDFQKAETDLNELKSDLEDIEENVLEEDVELNLDNIPEPEENRSENEETKDSDTDEESEDESSEDQQTEDEQDEDGDKEPDDPEDESDNAEDENDSKDDLTEMEKKQEVLEDLDMDLEEKDLEQISLEELEKLREEKQKREKLMDRLSLKFDRKQLEKVTTNDLEKLAEEVGEPEEISKQEA